MGSVVSAEVADFLSAGSARDKVVTAAEAIQLIRDGDTVAIEGSADSASRRS
jgi:hypothetical protein